MAWHASWCKLKLLKPQQKFVWCVFIFVDKLVLWIPDMLSPGHIAIGIPGMGFEIPGSTL